MECIDHCECLLPIGKSAKSNPCVRIFMNPGDARHHPPVRIVSGITSVMGSKCAQKITPIN